jgi:hypothetical protein
MSLPFQDLNRTHLREESPGISDIPMLAEFPVPKPEHIDCVVRYAVACRLMVQESFAGMGSCDSVIDVDKIALGDHLNDRGTGIGYGGKKALVKVDEPNPALVGIRIVLYIVVMHIPPYGIQIMLAEYFLIEIPHNILVILRTHFRSPPEVSNCPFPARSCFFRSGDARVQSFNPAENRLFFSRSRGLFRRLFLPQKTLPGRIFFPWREMLK